MKKDNVEACIEQALDQYFCDLDGETPAAIYDMVIKCVEKPMLRSVMQRAGNQSNAARILGINRNTLRKKLSEHGLAQ